MTQIEKYNKQEYAEDEIDLMELLKVLIKNSKLILSITIICFIGSMFSAANSPKIYTSEMTFLSDSSNGSSALSSLSDNPLIAMAGISSKAGSIDYLTILNSRTFREEVVKNNGLIKIYLQHNQIDISKQKNIKMPTLINLAGWLQGMVKVSKDAKSGVYKIEASHKDPIFAAKIANMYFDELNTYLKEKTLTKSKRNRKYLEKQIELVSTKLKDQEDELKSMEKKYNSISITDEAKAVGEMMAKLKTNILELNAQLKISADFAGEENLQYKKTKKEIETYTNQLDSIEKGTSGDISMIPAKDIPDIKIKMQRLQREVEATISIYKLLISQYESAKLEEIRDEAMITPLDTAIVPEVPIKPNKKLIIAVGAVLGLLFGIFSAFLAEFIKNTDWSKLKG